MQWDAARTLKTVTCEGIQADWESLESEQSNDAIYTYDYGFYLWMARLHLVLGPMFYTILDLHYVCIGIFMEPIIYYY
jgi:hypothetical protein